ncbi:5-oxoprolinase subunit PxpA [Amycolatopsis sp. FDAARGOS 1241]|uniref:5-oxoprolinase subunit PxpA n=1 Tax=Amycolatopsis sp. FDAARGOS 1241 TaxID=2778070 RepID=UPI001951CF17|nr:5-oxoprolinase subunit PxpA [Amycolatopsis sp. FDAARGOS 1241]QRP47829.1 5-oxoprolinase subunit PxpA [Amycolatopsis sp. FDAARGOS 1241]
MTATLNSDMGEGLGLHSFGNDETLLDLVDVINLACGFHAGDPDVMDATVAAAVAHDVRIGAHPGLPDLTGFGRRRMVLTPEEVESIVLYQVGALTAFLAKHGASLNHVKPHGALYGMLAGDPALMVGAARAAKVFGVPFFGIAGTAHETVCGELGVPFVAELYVDLDYDDEGNLIILRRPERTDPAAAAERVRRAQQGRPVLSVNGTELDIRFDSVCVHSDAPNSPDVAAAVRAVLDENQ